MPTKQASRAFRGPRQLHRLGLEIVTQAQFEAAFPLYCNWYMANRKSSLPSGWVTGNLPQLDADLLAYDGSVYTRNFLNHFPTYRRKADWYKRKFIDYRHVLGDNTIRKQKNGADIGDRGTAAPERNRESWREYQETEEGGIKLTIKDADHYQRAKEEREEEKHYVMQDFLLNSGNDLLTEYSTTRDLVNFVLRQCTFEEFPTCEYPRAAKALPFGAKTIHEAVQTGIQNHPHFHFNFCTTTRPIDDGEWHGYLTQNHRNCIFHYSQSPPGTNIQKSDLLDLQFIPILQYVGNANNGMDRILLEVESGCQSTYHQKLPVGTVGWRYNKAGISISKRGQEEEHVCTLFFVFSVCELLEKVEEGVLKISRTKAGPIANPLFNFDVWDINAWEPALIP
uniref:Uncharacterized protein n=1 Tax=Entomoneis paludosa TaxID=265537 RepID=A0A7S2VE60_9STRA|mmetsp:Transcript_18985/g.39293  ORF Transcript_18985/g.39293 Transcript_18985/m.39293 type:complete len:395 (+) Transcript_18985:488-1672(+)